MRLQPLSLILVDSTYVASRTVAMTKDVFPLTANAVRYIKLGTGNGWFEDAVHQIPR